MGKRGEVSVKCGARLGRSISVNGPRARSATRWAGSRGPRRDPRDRVDDTGSRSRVIELLDPSDDDGGVERVRYDATINSASRIREHVLQRARWGRTCPFSK